MTRHPADLGDERLGALLAAASAPARPDELTGEDEAARVYRSLRPAVPPAPRARRLIARVAVVKTVVALAMLGGVALAAKSSRIPEPPEAALQTGTTAAGERQADDDAPVPLVTEEPPTNPAEPPADPPPTTSDSPAAGFGRLCRLFLADRPKAHRDPGFPALADHAGGHKRVDDFCRDLLGVPEEDDENGDDEGNEGDEGHEDNEGKDPAKPGVPGADPTDKGRKPSAERTSVLLEAVSHKV
ncbi:hypothetical protein [Phytomonospora endophytica]|uniref:Uncharacterized protein n=1 Tax=Phytomonospora endophytica TaxID=714109 RepID=A0A841FRJ8_9ACTN|nr:hypothetical protein [Phytomonospora endophytica]MBB6038434.1 hypothetical protein [Phytomonospora endophytica]GIG64363.1 hypothetical protein Pen01_06580 [Phytomonospora endophytica]